MDVERIPHKAHPLHWIVEPLWEEDSYIEKPMFGCRGCYLHGRLILVLASKEEPWKGALLPTEREHQESLMKDFSLLEVHPILKKWLYLPENDEEFEDTVTQIVEKIQQKDPRIGVLPKPKKKKSKTKHAQ